MCGGEKSPSVSDWAGLISCALAGVFGCHGAPGVMFQPCDVAVTQRFFMASGMG